VSLLRILAGNVGGCTGFAKGILRATYGDPPINTKWSKEERTLVKEKLQEFMGKVYPEKHPCEVDQDGSVTFFMREDRADHLTVSNLLMVLRLITESSPDSEDFMHGLRLHMRIQVNAPLYYKSEYVFLRSKQREQEWKIHFRSCSTFFHFEGPHDGPTKVTTTIVGILNMMMCGNYCQEFGSDLLKNVDHEDISKALKPPKKVPKNLEKYFMSDGMTFVPEALEKAGKYEWGHDAEKWGHSSEYLKIPMEVLKALTDLHCETSPGWRAFFC